MISDWRRKFELPYLSFFYVQLAAFSSSQNFTPLRAAQDAALALPRVGVGLAIDLGDPTSPESHIHPRRKQEVGRRLSLSARAIQYGEQLVYKGPALSSVQLTSTGATLGYEPGTAGSLHLHGTAACKACCAETPFEAMDSNGTWSRVPATIAPVPAAVPAAVLADASQAGGAGDAGDRAAGDGGDDAATAAGTSSVVVLLASKSPILGIRYRC